MGCFQYTFHSAVLGMDTKIVVTIPDMDSVKRGASLDEIYDPARRFPVLWLCHGGSQDSSAWLRFSQAEMFAQEKQIMTVCFDAEESFCCDMVHGRKYLTYATQELPRLVRAYFPASDKREDNFVAGFSMGGHCAMKLALHNPELYSACMAMSGAKDQVKMVKLAKEVYGFVPPVHEDAFGPMDERLYGTENDLLFLAKQLKESGKEAPMLYMACGTKDYGYELAWEFKEYLDKVGLKNEFLSVPDAIHDYRYANYVLDQAVNKLFKIREVQ